jgi:hypothetical protein
MGIPRDKLLHIIAGLLIALNALFVIWLYQQFGAKSAISIDTGAIALAKEIWDRFNPPHEASFWDWLGTLLGALLIVLGLALWQSHQPVVVPASDPVAVPAPIAQAVRDELKIETPIPVKFIKAYKPSVKRELPLPEVVQASETQQVITASEVLPDDHPQIVTTVLDTYTGESAAYIAPAPYPWLRRDTRGEAGLYFGWRDGQKTLHAQAQQGLFDIKAFHFGALAMLDQALSGAAIKPDVFVGIGTWYRW